MLISISPGRHAVFQTVPVLGNQFTEGRQDPQAEPSHRHPPLYNHFSAPIRPSSRNPPRNLVSYASASSSIPSLSLSAKQASRLFSSSVSAPSRQVDLSSSPRKPPSWQAAPQSSFYSPHTFTPHERTTISQRSYLPSRTRRPSYSTIRHTLHICYAARRIRV